MSIEKRVRMVDEYKYVQTGRQIECREKKCPVCGEWEPDEYQTHYCGHCGNGFTDVVQPPQ